MPLYEYRCENCGHVFEVIQKFSDPPAEHCPSCGKGPVQKQMSSPAIQFKGSGWYITDYAKKSNVGSGKTEAGAAEKSGEKSSGSETKADAKPASGGETPKKD